LQLEEGNAGILPLRQASVGVTRSHPILGRARPLELDGKVLDSRELAGKMLVSRELDGKVLDSRELAGEMLVSRELAGKMPARAGRMPALPRNELLEMLA
jgi:hypothetical protein